MENQTQEIKYREGVDTYINMFDPQHLELDIELLVPMPENAEINGPLLFDERHNRLTESFTMFGQAKSVIVYPGENGTYPIIDGERITQAAKAAGFSKLSCIVLKVDKNRAFEIMQILNSGQRRETHTMKARKLELLERHAKKYLKECSINDNEASDLTVRQYMGVILQMSERSVTAFKQVCSSALKEELLDQMDKGLIKLHKAAKIAMNKNSKVLSLKKEIPLEQKQELTCEDCPRRNKFLARTDNYNDDVTSGSETESEDCHG